MVTTYLLFSSNVFPCFIGYQSNAGFIEGVGTGLWTDVCIPSKFNPIPNVMCQESTVLGGNFGLDEIMRDP